MSTIYTVVARDGGVVFLLGPNWEKRTVKINPLSHCIGANCQVKFEDDVIAVENMFYRANESQTWRRYCNIVTKRKGIVPIHHGDVPILRIFK